MKVKKGQVSLAFRLWVLATVFVWPFLEHWVIAAWAVLGAGLGSSARKPRLPIQPGGLHTTAAGTSALTA